MAQLEGAHYHSQKEKEKGCCLKSCYQSKDKKRKKKHDSIVYAFTSCPLNAIFTALLDPVGKSDILNTPVIA